ncbi:MAG: HlyC/CorC family transporter [Elainella sp. C42_A2020_010]|nr:HlyC/CorC family transporter [Elainella sp. C42_A2020_010]
MASVAFEILLILVLIIGNGVFAMSEIAVVSARKARLQQQMNQGNSGARAALKLANSPSRFLATVQIGITLVGILAGAFGGATIAEKLTAALRLVPALAPYSDALGFGIVVVCITYLSLVIGELVPKEVALNNPEGIAAKVAQPMQMLSKVTAPIVRILSISTQAVVKLLGVRASEEPSVTEDEIRLLIRQGTEIGTFKQAEQDIVERVFRLDDLPVSAIMTPRSRIVWLNQEESFEQNHQKIANSVYSRFPVCQGSLDEVLGVVLVKHLYIQRAVDPSTDLTDFLQQPLFIPESLWALKVLEMFQQTGMHIALVVDEYDVVQGLVTLNDILEAIVGDIPSVEEQNEPQAIPREDGSWLLDGMLPIEEFQQVLQLAELPRMRRSHYQTLGGFVIAYLGRIPTSADCFEWQGLRFEVVDMDGNRVDKVLVALINPPASKP